MIKSELEMEHCLCSAGDSGSSRTELWKVMNKRCRGYIGKKWSQIYGVNEVLREPSFLSLWIGPSRSVL